MKGIVVLIISRRPGERFVIGEGVTVEVLECSRGRVRLGVEAPPDVRVVREENLGRDDRDGSPSDVAAPADAADAQ